MSVPEVRVRSLDAARDEREGAFVLYWMTAFRRSRFNFALDRAVEHAVRLHKPLLIVEPLLINYPWANARLHTFVLEGMADNVRAFEKTSAHYFPFSEVKKGEVKALYRKLSQQACVVVTDDWPSFFLPRVLAAMAAETPVRVEAVDSNGLYPMWDTERVFTTAHSFRTHLQKTLAEHLRAFPLEQPLAGLRLPPLPKGVNELMERPFPHVKDLELDHSVPPVPTRGGSREAGKRLKLFVETKLRDYSDARNEPEVDGTSVLSAYLHFGHLSAHEVFREIISREKWSPEVLGKSVGGRRTGWWHLSAPAEAYLDQLITWRELAFNMSSHRPADYTKLSSLPAWAQATIRKHARDPRKHTYSLAEFESGKTHDPLWNAAQMQLVREGWFHNYLRMLWGKKILEWTPDAQTALDTMEHLMNRYSLDGRDPVSWGGYMWVLGRADRAWGPERAVFGSLRYMSSDNTARKVNVKNYVRKYAP